ncbi:MAG: Prolyl-tRNA synthetase [candidate division CPR1 bacterium GW2011_GWA2_42_17]|uniref:Proline--tRNA ligase n=1 Tax=candidate division CPR1 bacterium GW2011_GWA2_42_17 TaxID=1618341 RepID=A0A0G0Z496_9BACT|nr:MAG: Prolyl-tRNA synthetase [candidate division CPR1 bacterium GW2011_GWA2_42_17]
MLYRLNKFIGKSSKTGPAEEPSANAQLLERAGFVFKYASGLYEYLPFGLAVLKKIENIIRKNLNALSCQEVLMTSLQPKGLWRKTGRWDDMAGVMYQFKDHSGKDFGLSMTHEEPITQMAARAINSYKDLPFCAYQIQTKHRDESRAKSGVIRGREFIMKDAYSFHASQEDFEKFYAVMTDIYQNIFKECGLDSLVVEAPGGSFSKVNSHEFQVLSPAGEDKILFCDKCQKAFNRDLFGAEDTPKCLVCGGELIEKVGIEVGNIFQLGTKYSAMLGCEFTDSDGKKQPVIMGCYGIGVSRLLGTIVEVSHDDKGMIWPASVAPAVAQVMVLSEDDGTKKLAEQFLAQAEKSGLALVYDDRDVSAGVKLAEADLLGLPYRVVVSEKNAGQIEIKKRTDTNTKLVDLAEVLAILNVES